jgi:endonuclease/exonuclease/phosphatase family metal-dependent hydrolase
MRWPISCTPLALAPLKRYRITHNPRLTWRSYYEATMRALILLALLLMAVPAWAQEIKLATWNIAWLTTKPAGHPDLPQNLTIRTEQDFARLRAYAERLAADVIALQEVDGPLGAARVFDATAYDFHFPAESDVQRTGFAWRKGLQVTRNPDLMALDLRPTARRSLRRGADITLHGANGARLRLLSIHLDGGCSQGSIRQPNSSDCQSLGQQAQILAEWITERRRENMPFVILGDFNRRFSRDDDMLSMLNAASPMRRATEGLSNPCWSRDGQGRAFIDHILLGLRAADWLVKDSFRVFSYGERDPALRDVISDHCPISVRLQLP